MHLETITSKQKWVFEKLDKFPEFYLVGGTALALQIGHRISVDFDLFSKKDITLRVLNKVRRIFKGSKIEVIREHSEQLSVTIDRTKVDFVKYPFPLLFKLIKYQGVSISKISEIAVMKAYTMGRRETLKDYIDLYYILKEKHVTLEKIIKLSQKKYKREFNPRLFLEQLIHPEDVQDMQIDFLKKPVTKQEMEKFFRNEVKEIIYL
ncbi:nucleotidyl transferase AbiEii/AbiGii toxin family protein [Patescibacteria group bacterium]|nr:nucleotidyl transferase AbiEii/AbiGii toxin family protein [Patescibacteria group bacterium]